VGWVRFSHWIYQGLRISFHQQNWIFPNDLTQPTAMRNRAISSTIPVGSSIHIREAIEHFRLSVSGMQSVEGSHSSTVRILCLESGEKLVLKIPFSHTKMLREMRTLQRLHGKLPVPKVVDYWVRDDDSPGVLLLSWLQGQPITGTVTPDLSLKLGEP